MNLDNTQEDRMKNTKLKFGKVATLSLFCLAILCTTDYGLWNFSAEASNVNVDEVKIKGLNPFVRTAQIEFRLSQESPYLAAVLGAEDYIWVFGKYWLEGEDSAATGWHHLELVDNRKGIFIPAQAAGETGDIFVLTWDFTDNDELLSSFFSGKKPVVRICAIEMVRIPQEDDKSFYLAKYEVSQAQYADYLNMLDAITAQNCWVGRQANGYAIDYNPNAEYGARFTAAFPERACNFISFLDAVAYADWAGLRLPSESEWEKVAVGPQEIAGEENLRIYPWGVANPTQENAIYEKGSSTGHYQYYANFGNLQGADEPTDVGFYCLGDIMRSIAQIGTSPFGIPDLAGNVAEWVMNSEKDFGLKGGSFASDAEQIRIKAAKKKLEAEVKSPEAGLRLAR